MHLSFRSLPIVIEWLSHQASSFWITMSKYSDFLVSYHLVSFCQSMSPRDAIIAGVFHPNLCILLPHHDYIFSWDYSLLRNLIAFRAFVGVWVAFSNFHCNPFLLHNAVMIPGPWVLHLISDFCTNFVNVTDFLLYDQNTIAALLKSVFLIQIVFNRFHLLHVQSGCTLAVPHIVRTFRVPMFIVTLIDNRASAFGSRTIQPSSWGVMNTTYKNP